MAALADTSASCNTSTLTQHLAEHGLMAYGQTGSHADLTDRNSDRVRILKFIAQHPEGVRLSNLVHWVLKGVRTDNYYGFHDLSGNATERNDKWNDTFYDRTGNVIALDGSDDDYQFALRFVTETEQETRLLRIENRHADETRGRHVFPTHRLLDLISEGISETVGSSSDLVYDREFCQKMLKATRSDLLALSDPQKKHLANSLRRYIQRTRDYRLAFDVHLADRNGYQKRRMEKPFATRFTDSGRVDKNFAMLHDSLEWGADRADSAVFCTLTTDPRKFDSLYDAIMQINENFHALNQWMKSDPSTKGDTRKTGTPTWTGPDCGVTGRPRKKLEYVKCLEFTSKGYPHLHVLYFDPPTRESDGMPWLCDKNELSHQWNKDTENRTGQGRIVDTYPMVHRDDLDELDAKFNTDEGFVSWYRYGDHGHSQEWIEDRVRFHQKKGQIDFDGKDENPMQKTAGSYIGKYVSETQASLTNLEQLDDPDFETEYAAEKSAWWKLALYWTTNRWFWSPSRTIRKEIELDSDRSEIRRGVADVTRTSLLHHSERLDPEHAQYPDFNYERAESYLHPVVRDVVNSQDLEAQDVGENVTTLARIEYLGAFHVADMPASPETTVNPDVLEAAVYDDDPDVALASTGDRPPPVVDTWG